mmetsp:Transcript_19170/g.13765  ORF Transcript_19170/g.13765 Transcript_19170/m.13765 type:complete len:122 (+) Transcript_19170:79-444(+)
MVKFSRQPAEPTKSAKTRVADLRAHFKNTYETARACKGLKLLKAIRYMENVLEHKQIVPFKKFVRHAGRHAQTKEFKTSGSIGRWPEKSVKAVLELLKNLHSNSEARGLNVEKCVITHCVV